jgi:hypothetical protein
VVSALDVMWIDRIAGASSLRYFELAWSSEPRIRFTMHVCTVAACSSAPSASAAPPREGEKASHRRVRRGCHGHECASECSREFDCRMCRLCNQQVRCVLAEGVRPHEHRLFVVAGVCAGKYLCCGESSESAPVCSWLQMWGA